MHATNRVLLSELPEPPCTILYNRHYRYVYIHHHEADAGGVLRNALGMRCRQGSPSTPACDLQVLLPDAPLKEAKRLFNE